MAEAIFPTKGNLIAVQRTLSLARLGYDLMERKRNILIRELTSLIDKANAIKDSIDTTYRQAYYALQMANITLGVCEEIAKSVPVDNGVSMVFRSVMGVEIPIVSHESPTEEVFYGFSGTNTQLDKAYKLFNQVKELTIQLTEIENSVFRLAIATKKTRSRTNALQNIIIPSLEDKVRFISTSIEEKEREEFSRLKVIKSRKQRRAAAIDN